MKWMGFVDDNVFAPRVPLVRRPEVVKPPFNVQEVRAWLDSQNRRSHSGAPNQALMLS